MYYIFFFFFFFQAEDGIRDVAVTGVQTCALPISPSPKQVCAQTSAWAFNISKPGSAASAASPFTRSEEHTSELQSRLHLVCRLLLEKKKHDQPKRSDHKA